MYSSLEGAAGRHHTPPHLLVGVGLVAGLLSKNMQNGQNGAKTRKQNVLNEPNGHNLTNLNLWWRRLADCVQVKVICFIIGGSDTLRRHLAWY